MRTVEVDDTETEHSVGRGGRCGEREKGGECAQWAWVVRLELDGPPHDCG
jgi:hypothetical protein